MAIINNANPGSQINLLCLIYRVIHRNNGKFSVDDITSLCRPKNLPNKEGHLKRFPENLTFWMKPEHQLWYEGADSKLILAEITDRDEPLPIDIAVATNKALFKTLVPNICDQGSHDTKIFFWSLSCIMACDRFVFPNDSKIEHAILDNLFAKFLPEHKAPNNSEKTTFLEYADFLGFFEKQGNSYLVDPTRAILGELSNIFYEKSLPVDDFINLLCEKLPVLDKGIYRKEVEDIMLDNGLNKMPNNYLSKSLSHALFRLRRMKKIRFMTVSDDANAVTLQLPDNKIQLISSIEYLAGDDK